MLRVAAQKRLSVWKKDAGRCSLGFDSQLGQGLSLWSLHVLAVFTWVSPTVKTCMLAVSTVSTLDRGTFSESGVGPLCVALRCAALRGWDGSNAKTKYNCALYV